MKLTVPGNGSLAIENLLLDLNGTLSVGGDLVEGVEDRISRLRENYTLILLSGNSRGNAEYIAKGLDIQFRETKNGSEKRDVVHSLGADTCAAIGNGLIDLEFIESAHLGIVTMQGEGAHTKTLLAADIVVPSINDALDLFIDTNRLVATLRR